MTDEWIKGTREDLEKLGFSVLDINEALAVIERHYRAATPNYAQAWKMVRVALGLPEDHPDGSDVLPKIAELRAATTTEPRKNLDMCTCLLPGEPHEEDCPLRAATKVETCPTCNSRERSIRGQMWVPWQEGQTQTCNDWWHSPAPPEKTETCPTCGSAKWKERMYYTYKGELRVCDNDPGHSPAPAPQPEKEPK